MLVIDKSFVQEWSKVYDDRFEGGSAETEETAIRSWLARQTEPKYLNKEYFLKLAHWKSPRPGKLYESNSNGEIVSVTRSAYIEPVQSLKLEHLMTLKGVGVAVASTILHFLRPDKFPIFDYHCRFALKEARLWTRDKDDASQQAWLDYVQIMRKVSQQIGVTLRDLDKAMFAYDKRKTYCPR